MNENQTVMGLPKKTVLWIGIIALLLILLCLIIFLLFRKGPDLSNFKKDIYYVAQDSTGDVVLCLDKVTDRKVSGKWYREEGGMAKPHHFVAKSRWLRRNVLKSDSVIIKANAQTGGDTLVLDMLLDDSWRTLRFVPWQQPEGMTIQKEYPYHSSLYKVSCDKDVVYGSAKGYWTSYPEPNDGSDYFSIMLKKLNFKDMNPKDLDLKMDVYYPVTSDTSRRPLLMLIHGGAFFNGDKASHAYVEWGKRFASMGYVVASINYRLGFRPLKQAHMDRAGYRALQDAYAAMSYLLRHSERYPIDPNQLFVGGSSAGGITALNLAFMRNPDRPACTYQNKVNKAAEKVDRVISWLYIDRLLSKIDVDISEDVGMDDLGDIEAVAGSGAVNFNINAVVNMWGALHEVDMLKNSKGTAILSFHGDADSIVPYGYDYPFTKVKTPARDFIRKIRQPLIDMDMGLAKMTNNALASAEHSMKPINQFLCGKMYGSKSIHDVATSPKLDMVSELHTKAGGGHSLHVNDDGSLSDYFTVITDTTTRFLYLRMFPRPTMKTTCAEKQQWFELDNAGELQTCRWEAAGGLVLEAEPDKVRVIFFDDADKHELKICGQEKNGQDYCETYSIGK
ncbi:MAG: alpha/beta hydrolase [Bacteroidales bacterium]|nr:alpha/beta hydrolase [Bacteroidales bacterium]